jgi:hypothetical protein
VTVELVSEGRVARANAEARKAGHPVVESEVIWDEPDGYYHHYPALEQVRSWLTDAGFTIIDEAQGPLARRRIRVPSCPGRDERC